MTYNVDGAVSSGFHSAASKEVIFEIWLNVKNPAEVCDVFRKGAACYYPHSLPIYRMDVKDINDSVIDMCMDKIRYTAKIPYI